MRVVASILVFDNPHGVVEVLRCLGRQTVTPDAVVVVDNGSRVPLGPEVGERVDRLERSDVNLGVGGGHNLGVRTAVESFGADHVWVLEHDTFPEDDCLERLLEVARDEPLAAVAPYGGRNLYESLRRPRRGTAPDTAFTFNGLLLPRTAVETAGPIREDYFVGQEDWEYAARLGAAGVPVISCFDAIVLHSNRGAERYSTHVSPSRLYYSVRNITFERRPASVVGRVRATTVAAVAAVAQVVRPGRGLRCARARWAGHRDGMRGRLGPTTRRF